MLWYDTKQYNNLHCHRIKVEAWARDMHINFPGQKENFKFRSWKKNPLVWEKDNFNLCMVGDKS